MARVKSRDTGPELTVRRILTRMGHRYRLHRVDLPGTPDIVFIRRRKAVFVHGCFWHGHDCSRGARVPKNNADYWQAKIARNQVRDSDADAALREMGWTSLSVWECQLKDEQDLGSRLENFIHD